MSPAESCDVIVVGAGIAGAGIAAELAAQGKRVVLVERESQPGAHSTGRSAALYSAVYGGGVIRALSLASHPFFTDPPPGFTEAPLLRPRGALHVATPEQADHLAAFAALPDVAPLTRQLDGPALTQLCPILRPGRFVLGVLEPEASDIDVHLVHGGYLKRLREAGGTLALDCGVDGVERIGGLWRVRCGERTFEAPVLVNAAGAWADKLAGLAGLAPLGLEPKRRTAVLVDAPEGAAIADWPMVIDADEQFYIKPDAGQLLLSPADETPSEPCDAQPDEWDIAVAVDRVEAATTLQVRRIRHRWAGLRSFLPDRSPAAGFDPLAEGFFWLAGQGGYGIQSAPALSRTAAAILMTGETPTDIADAGVDAAALSPARFRG